MSMKKSELVLGNIIKGYKGEKEFTITNISEEAVILDGEKEVKVGTLLKNYKLVKAVENKVEIELPTFQLKLMAPIISGLLPEAKSNEKVGTIYGIKVVKGVNQTLIWKVLKKVCENKDEQGTVVANNLKAQYPDAFKGAVRCLVSKKRINYIESIIEA